VPSARRHGFPRDRRLRKRRQFIAVQSSGEKASSRHFVVIGRPRDDGDATSRLGITVTRRVGGAVTRNRIKRLVREFVRQSDWLGCGRDIVVIAKRSAADIGGLGELERDLSSVDVSGQ